MPQLGYEFAKFRLKEGASRDDLIETARSMDVHFFPTQQGFISHSLIELDGDEFVDMVIARTKTAAETICGNWSGNAYCEAFLALVDKASVSIGFGQELNCFCDWEKDS